MSTTQRVSGNLTIQTLNATDQITFLTLSQLNIDSPSVIVNGNLFVTGNSQTISSVDSAINNNQIVLNSGWSGTPVLNANITVARGTSANASIGWNEALKTWQVFNGTTVGNLSSTALSSVSADPNPALGGNLNLSGRTVWDSTSAAGVQLSIGALGAGGSGLHVTNTNYGNVELINKTKSIVYSIIFG